MLAYVRFVVSQCFSAPQKSICFSPSPPPLSLLERAAARLPRPWRAADRSIRPLCCGIIGLCTLTPCPSVVAGGQDNGKGRGGEGGTIIAFPGSILGDARRPLSAPCRAQQAVRPGRCAEKLLVLFASLHDSLCGCCCSQGKGRRRRERAGSSCTRLRHEKDDDKEDKKKVETVLISTI